jgi:hypothetical protein
MLVVKDLVGAGVGSAVGSDDVTRQNVRSSFEKPLEHSTHESDLPYDMEPGTEYGWK